MNFITREPMNEIEQTKLIYEPEYPRYLYHLSHNFCITERARKALCKTINKLFSNSMAEICFYRPGQTAGPNWVNEHSKWPWEQDLRFISYRLLLISPSGPSKITITITVPRKQQQNKLYPNPPLGVANPQTNPREFTTNTHPRFIKHGGISPL